MLLTYVRNLLSFEHYINMFNKIAGPAMFCLCVFKDVLDVFFYRFLGLLLYLMFLLQPVSHYVMGVCRISIKITVLTYLRS